MITVVMPVRNADKTLSKSIESVLSQSYKNFEFFILDDASTDNSSKIIYEYSIKDSRIKLFKNKDNLGLTKSLNLLISEANNKYIARQDSDDLSEISRFEKQVQYLEKSKYRACTSRATILNKSSKIPKFSYFLPNNFIIKFKNPFIHGSLMIEKKLLDEVGGYDENFYYSQDYKLFIDILNSGEKIKTLYEPLYILNVINNISTIYKDEQRSYAIKARKYL